MPDKPKTDLERAYEALDAKQEPYTTLFNYYDGDQPVVYTTKKIKEVFQDIDARFTQNWCAVVIDSAKDRINLKGFEVSENDSAQTKLEQLWKQYSLALEADDVHEAALVAGESYMIVWKDDENGLQPYFNDPRLVHLFYNAENPRQKDWAAKWWQLPDGRLRMILYYPDRLEYYITDKKRKDVKAATAFRPLGGGNEGAPEADNPFGAVPIFHFRPERRKIKSDLKNVIEPQDGINKLLADMMVAAEFGAFPQRYVISQAEQGNLKNAPNELWWIPAGDGEGEGSKVGQFNSADLGNYLKAIDSLATAIGIITRTPKHYFFNTGGDPSGEALIAQEAPLNKKCEDRIMHFTPVWRELAAFMLELDGVKDVDQAAIEPRFERPETVQPKTQAEIRKANRDAGIPITTSLRWEGKSESEINQLQEDIEEEKVAERETLAQAMLELERRRDRGEDVANGAQGQS